MVAGCEANEHLKETRSSGIAEKPPDAEVPRYCDFYLPLSHLTSSGRGSSRANGFMFGTEKPEWLGYNLVKVARW